MGYVSNENDHTYDLLDEFKIKEIDNEGNLIYHTDSATVTNGLKKMFDQLDNMIKKRDSVIEQKKEPYNINHDAYTGVIIDMLLHFCEILVEYLEKMIVYLIGEHKRISRVKESSEWKNYKERLYFLKYEILLIKYAIEHGTPIKVPEKYIDRTDTILCIPTNNLLDFIDNQVTGT